ncbi:MAG: FkbM family methyltransferase [Usitatibacter sp.]
MKSRLPARFGNFPIIVSPDARLGFWRRGVEQVDPTLLSVAEELVKPGHCVWDIGANVGIFAMAAAARAGTSGFVLAVEGDTWLVDLMRRSCQLESSPRAPIDVLPVAVDAELGIATFNIANRGRAANHLQGTGYPQAGGAREQQRVPAVSLDWLLGHFRKPDVLKIDVEGAELRVLSGAKAVLAEARPILICEVASEHAREVSDLLSLHRYALYDMEQAPPRDRIALATANIIAIPS